MTSRQPEAAAPQPTGKTVTPPVRLRATPGQPWTMVLLMALLIVLGIAGLHGTIVRPRWNGPLRDYGVGIGLGLEAVCGVLLVTLIRRRSALSRAAARPGGVPLNHVAARLRLALIATLGAGMIVLAVTIDNNLPHRVNSSVQNQALGMRGPRHHDVQKHARPAVHHFPLAAVLYGAVIVVFVAAIVLSIWWARRARVRMPASPDLSLDIDRPGQDSDDLREAVQSGRSALRVTDDTRAAIIACYVAMERRLTEQGASRTVADTPDELLARATSAGIVRGSAAAQLTALFYEARFSTHPMDRGQRAAAEWALDELAAALAPA